MHADRTSRLKSLVGRCAAIDWRRPAHDPARVAAAYERWLATFGLRRRIRWVADPADVEAWQPRGDGVAQVWAIMAAGAAPFVSPIAMMLRARGGLVGLRANGPSAADVAAADVAAADVAAADVAASWAFAITSHMTTVEVAWNAWAHACVAMAARAPALAWAVGLLCPGVPWPAPPMVARAAAEVLPACADETIWTALADTMARAAEVSMPQGHRVVMVPTTQHELLDALLTVAEPMLAACEAGAFAHTLLDDEVVVLAAPALWTEGRRLHRADGHALAWPRTRVHAWKGMILPRELIADPDVLTPDLIRAVSDQPQFQHAMIDLYAHRHGHRRCLQDLGGVVMHEDHAGRLWWLARPQPPQPADFKLVEVVNGTAEPDGSRKTYWLNVPPEMRTAREAVAWTYGMRAEEYDGLVVRT